MDPQPFLIVSETFALARLGLLVAPAVDPELLGFSANGQRALVRLLRPDGSQARLEARFLWQHTQPGGSRYVCCFAASAQLPPGTRLYLDGA